MSEEDKRKNYLICEICGEPGGSDVIGGLNKETNERGLWLVCKECLQKIKDERKNK